MKTIKLIILMLAITFMTIVTGCELTVAQDESGLVNALDELDNSLNTLQLNVMATQTIFFMNLQDVFTKLEVLELDVATLQTQMISLANSINERLADNEDERDLIVEMFESLKGIYIVHWSGGLILYIEII